MAVDVIVSHQSLSGLHEVFTFSGSAQDRTELQLTTVEPVPGTNADRFYLRDATSNNPRRVAIGTLFVRPLRQPNPTDVPVEAGPWSYWADSWESKEDAIRLNLRAQTAVEAPGASMTTPLGNGAPLFLNQVRVVRPASGQPDVSRWTGEVLVPEVLVP